MFKNKNTFLLLILFFGLHLFLLMNLKFTAWPEMLLWPYLMIHNLLPYKDVAIVHTPHLIVHLAIFYKIFGVGTVQLKIYTWFFIAITDLIVFWVVNKLFNKRVALISILAFMFWQLFFDGNGLWFDLMLVPIAILMFLLVEKKKYFLSGIFWVIMFFTKQTAVWFLIPIAYEMLRNKNARQTNILNFIYGTITTSLIFLIGIWLWGVFPNFYNWAINFGIFVLPKSQGQIQLPDIKNLTVSLFPFLVFIPLILKTRGKNVNLLIWAIAGVMGAYPRFEYFHFQPALPFLAIATALTLEILDKKTHWFKLFIIFYIFGSIYLFANFFMRNWGEGVRFNEADVTDVVNYVKSNSKPGDKIFVMNWWDNIYPLTNTFPATDPWVPQLSWYQELPGIQDEEVKNIASSKPKLILLQDYTETGLSSYIPQKVYSYVLANYKLKEKIDGIEILVPKK